MENRVTEPKRLACLRGLEILDTASEEAFDRLTQLAADAVGVPVAFTSLVDEARVWLKSKVGTTLCEAPRSESFCPHTIALGDVLVVEDATLDSRFAALHLVVAEGVRFYAGAPVALANGAVVGAVCVIDVVPRPTPSPPAIALLKGLAAAAGHLLDLRRELLARREAERRLAEHARLLELAEEMAGIGTFRFDVATGALDVSPSILGIFGLGPTACAPPVDALLAMFEPSERAKIVGGSRRRAQTGRLTALMQSCAG
jgi:GAF domain-containing protein